MTLTQRGFVSLIGLYQRCLSPYKGLACARNLLPVGVVFGLREVTGAADGSSWVRIVVEAQIRGLCGRSDYILIHVNGSGG